MFNRSPRRGASERSLRSGSRPPAVEPLEPRTLFAATTPASPPAPPIRPDAYIVTSLSLQASAATAASLNQVSFSVSISPPSATGEVFIYEGTIGSGGNPVETATLTGSGSASATLIPQPPTFSGPTEFYAMYDGNVSASGSAYAVSVSNTVLVNFSGTGSGGTGTGVTKAPGPTGGSGTTGGGNPVTGTGGTGPGSSTTTLAPAITHSTLPVSTITDRPVKGTISLKITNSSAALSSGRDTVTLYGTTDGAIDSTSAALATVAPRLKLKPGASATLKVHVKPRALPAGVYALIAQATDSSGILGTSSTGGTLTVAPATVTLSAVASSVRPSTARPRQVVSFTLTLTNTGNVASTGLASITLGLSADQMTALLPIGTLHRKLTIRPGGKSVAVRMKLKLPAAAAGMTLYPLVTVTQGTATATAISPAAVTVS